MIHIVSALLFTLTNVGWSIFPCPANPLAASRKGKKINLRLQSALPALMAALELAEPQPSQASPSPPRQVLHSPASNTQVNVSLKDNPYLL